MTREQGSVEESQAGKLSLHLSDNLFRNKSVMTWFFQTAKYIHLFGVPSLCFSEAMSNEFLTAVMFRDWRIFSPSSVEKCHA